MIISSIARKSKGPLPSCSNKSSLICQKFTDRPIGQFWYFKHCPFCKNSPKSGTHCLYNTRLWTGRHCTLTPNVTVQVLTEKIWRLPVAFFCRSPKCAFCALRCMFCTLHCSSGWGVLCCQNKRCQRLRELKPRSLNRWPCLFGQQST